jgi:DNA-directed RNA polymerase subunit RPC12/RpoP
MSKNREAAQKTFLNRVEDATGLEALTLSKKSVQGLVYECVKCGAIVSSDELELRGGGVKCTICGYRVLKKIRPPVVKRVTGK